NSNLRPRLRNYRQSHRPRRATGFALRALISLAISKPATVGRFDVPFQITSERARVEAVAQRAEWVRPDRRPGESMASIKALSKEARQRLCGSWASVI